jgi:succinoglycan biosynthesis protein ExoA
LAPSRQEWPRVSVVIPVRNEAPYIARNLEAVLAQDYPANRLEVLVADGRSDDGTRAIIESFARRAPETNDRAPVLLVDNPDRIMPAGTNAAIRRASGEFILLLGGHASLPPGYVRACVDLLLESDADGASGALDSVGRGFVGEAIAAAMSSPFGIGNSGFRTATGGAPVVADTIPFPVFRRAVYERVGLYNPRMVRHQDYEFNYRVRQSGGRMLLLPALKATYHVRPSLRALWRQYWQYGVWKGRFVRRYPQSLRFRHLVPAGFALALVVSALVSLFLPAAPWAFAALAVPYAAFLLLGALSFALKGRARVAVLTPVVMVCLHLSYGLGVWIGLAQPPVPDAPRLEPKGG